MMAYSTDIFFAVPGETRGTLAISFFDSSVEAGIPAKDMLKIMTANAAKLLGVEKQRGAIKPGLFADIYRNAGDPLDNIQTQKKVSFVMKEGKIYKSIGK
jgi:imidazolonepropionase-like amidohydrolase